MGRDGGLVVARRFRRSPGSARLDHRKSRTVLDNACLRPAVYAAGAARPLPLHRPSQLPDRRRRNRDVAAGLRRLANRPDFFGSERRAARVAHPHRRAQPCLATQRTGIAAASLGKKIYRFKGSLDWHEWSAALTSPRSYSRTSETGKAGCLAGPQTVAL